MTGTILHWSADGVDALPLRRERLVRALAGEVAQVLAAEAAEARAPVRAARVTRADLPALAGRAWPARLKKLAAAMAGHDLICTWGSGALDAVLAHTLFADVYKLAPLVHHEGSGGNAGGLRRRIALGRTAAIIVPDHAAERLALGDWQQPRGRVRMIPTGIDTAPLAAARAKRDGVPGIVKRRDERWLGTVADGGDLAPLLSAMAGLPQAWQLVIAGQGVDRDAVLAEAAVTGNDHRVHFAGSAHHARVLPLFDLFAATGSLPEVTLLEAMAAGLPILVPRGAARGLLASENGPVLPADAHGLTKAVLQLAGDDAGRGRIGTANRALARAEHDEAKMIERYRALYRSLMGK